MTTIDIPQLIDKANKEQRVIAIAFGILGLCIWALIGGLGWGLGWVWNLYQSEQGGRSYSWWPWLGAAIGVLIFVPSFARFLISHDDEIESPEEFSAMDSILGRDQKIAGQVAFAFLEMAPKLAAEAVLAMKHMVKLDPDELVVANMIVSELDRLNDWVSPNAYAAHLKVLVKLINADILRTKQTYRGTEVRLNPTHMD